MALRRLVQAGLAGTAFFLARCAMGNEADSGIESTRTETATADRTSASPAFAFQTDNDRFRILPGGVGTRGERDTIRLGPLDSGATITRVDYARHGDVLVLVTEQRRSSAARGQADAFDDSTFERRWSTPIPAAPVGPALVADSTLFVTGRGFVGAIDLAKGRFRWRHGGLADISNNRFIAFRTPVVRNGEVVFAEDAASGARADSIRVELPSGMIIGASRPILGARATSPAGSPSGVLEVAWPMDRDAYQVGAEYNERELATIPQCSGELPVLAADSLGPLRPGLTVAEILDRCGQALLLWEWGDAPEPRPAMLVRLGNAAVTITVADTLASSQAIGVATSDPSVRTRAGIGPGMTFGELRAALGAPRSVRAENCVLVATFTEAPLLAWSLAQPRELTNCARVNAFAGRGALAPVAPETRALRVALRPGS